ncbi:Phage portal protein [Hyphomicrobiales bacterium]|nr:Phage portal protein [Hyphomicrobiales bacterium]CAH1673388.1 Phage portal protein [Hyphomicrobiales bacterium]
MINRLKNIIGFEKKSTLANSSPELLALFGAGPTASGTVVTPETAMRCTTVFASVKVIAESVAQLPLHLYRRTDDGGKERAGDHPLAELLHDQANEWTSAFEFRLFMQTALCLHGNAFAFINRADGKIFELIPIPSPAIEVQVDRVTMEPSYKVTEGDGSQRIYPRTDIFHLKTLGTSPHVGLSPISQMKEAIGLAIAMEEHGARLFGNGARPSGVFKYHKMLTGQQVQQLRERMAGHTGGGSGQTLVLEDGMDFKALQFTSVDLQFMELRRQQIAEIARGFRIPLHLLQELERTTHANAESMGQQFLSLTLLPWLKMWEGAIRRALLSPEERRGYQAEFLTDDLARADLAARFDAYAKAVTNGLLCPNEVRAAENRAPYPGGDQFRLPMNTEDASKTSAA